MSVEESQRQFLEAHEKMMAEKQLSSPEVSPEEAKKEEISEQAPIDNTPQYTEQEQEAMKQGWKPKDQFSGPNWVDANEYLRVGSILKRMKQSDAHVSELKNTIKELVDHNKRLEKATYEKAYRDAMQARRHAVEEGDTVAFERADLSVAALEKEINRLDQPEPVSKVEPVPQQQEISKDIIEFQNRHSSWLNGSDSSSLEMQKEMQIYVRHLQLENEEHIKKTGQDLYTEKQAVDLVENRIKRLYPDRFENPNKDKPSVVGRSSLPTSNKMSPMDRLSDQQKAIFRQALAVDPSLKIDDVIRQLEITGRLK